MYIYILTIHTIAKTSMGRKEGCLLCQQDLGCKEAKEEKKKCDGKTILFL